MDRRIRRRPIQIKMKTTIERIFETLSKEKVELKSEKIELGLLDDIKNTSNKLKKMWESSLEIAVDGAAKLATKTSKSSKALNNEILALKKEIQEFEKKIKDLGVNINDVPNFKKFEKELQIAEARSKRIDKVIGDLRNIY